MGLLATRGLQLPQTEQRNSADDETCGCDREVALHMQAGQYVQSDRSNDSASSEVLHTAGETTAGSAKRGKDCSEHGRRTGKTTSKPTVPS